MAVYMTGQRKLLLEFLQSNFHKQLSAKKIKEALKDNSISLSSIYRSLAFLEKQGLVRRILSDENTVNEALYQYIDENRCFSRIHLICEKCGNTSHLSESREKILVKLLLKDSNFYINSNKTVIYGTCESCKSYK